MTEHVVTFPLGITAAQASRGMRLMLDGNTEAFFLDVLRNAYAKERITLDELEALTEHVLSGQRITWNHDSTGYRAVRPTPSAS